MRRTRYRVGLAIAAAVAMLALPESESAKQYQMSGRWFMRNGQVFIPLQFPRTPTGLRASMGTGTVFGGPHQHGRLGRH